MQVAAIDTSIRRCIACMHSWAVIDNTVDMDHLTHGMSARGYAKEIISRISRISSGYSFFYWEKHCFDVLALLVR